MCCTHQILAHVPGSLKGPRDIKPFKQMTHRTSFCHQPYHHLCARGASVSDWLCAGLQRAVVRQGAAQERRDLKRKNDKNDKNLTFQQRVCLAGCALL